MRSFDQKVSAGQLTPVYSERRASMSTDPFLAFAPNLWQPAHPLPFRHLSWTEAILSAVACLLHGVLFKRSSQVDKAGHQFQEFYLLFEERWELILI